MFRNNRSSERLNKTKCETHQIDHGQSWGTHIPHWRRLSSVSETSNLYRNHSINILGAFMLQQSVAPFWPFLVIYKVPGWRILFESATVTSVNQPPIPSMINGINIPCDFTWVINLMKHTHTDINDKINETTKQTNCKLCITGGCERCSSDDSRRRPPFQRQKWCERS